MAWNRALSRRTVKWLLIPAFVVWSGSGALSAGGEGGISPKGAERGAGQGEEKASEEEESFQEERPEEGWEEEKKRYGLF